MQVEVKPISVPTMLIDKDWSKRPCFAFEGLDSLTEDLHNFKVRDDDIFVETLPKSGTTWMQELVWLIANDFDFERAKSEDLDDRSPSFEISGMKKIFGLVEGNTFEDIDELSSPRVIKSHYSLALLPKELWEKKPKVIYVFRDPRDAMVSMYYYSKSLGTFPGKELEEVVSTFLEFEMKNKAMWNHVFEFYQLRNEDWIYYTSYEMMKKDLGKVIADICYFLEKPITEDQMNNMLDHLSFKKMKDNKNTNHINETEAIRNVVQGEVEDHQFIRRGQVGGYKRELSTELCEKLDKWVEDSLKPFDLTLDDLLLLN